MESSLLHQEEQKQSWEDHPYASLMAPVVLASAVSISNYKTENPRVMNDPSTVVSSRPGHGCRQKRLSSRPVVDWSTSAATDDQPYYHRPRDEDTSRRMPKKKQRPGMSMDDGKDSWKKKARKQNIDSLNTPGDHAIIISPLHSKSNITDTALPVIMNVPNGCSWRISDDEDNESVDTIEFPNGCSGRTSNDEDNESVDTIEFGNAINQSVQRKKRQRHQCRQQNQQQNHPAHKSHMPVLNKPGELATLNSIPKRPVHRKSKRKDTALQVGCTGRSGINQDKESIDALVNDNKQSIQEQVDEGSFPYVTVGPYFLSRKSLTDGTGPSIKELLGVYRGLRHLESHVCDHESK